MLTNSGYRLFYIVKAAFHNKHDFCSNVFVFQRAMAGFTHSLQMRDLARTSPT